MNAHALPKRGLGRGLASLIPDSALDAPNEANRSQLRMVPLDEVRPNPMQPREVFDSAALNELADSIRRHGILMPLVVRREEGHYILVAGERRLRAAALAGLTEVPVVIRTVTERSQELELALVENLQRMDLDPLEAAKGYQRLIMEFGYTQDEVATRVGKERPTVANALRLLKLPEFVLDALRHNRISAGHARALLPLVSAEDSRRVLARIVGQELSVRATEQVVGKIVREDDSEDDAKPAPRGTHEYATKLLSDALHTSVQIRTKRDGSGAILIDFADAEDLDRLIRSLRNE